MENKENSNTVVLNNIEIGKRLVKLRQNEGLTQYALAEEFGCNRVTLSNYERGKDTISLDALTFYRNKFHVSADYILYGLNLEEKDERNLINELELLLKKYRCK